MSASPISFAVVMTVAAVVGGMQLGLILHRTAWSKRLMKRIRCLRRGHDWKTVESYPKQDVVEAVAFDMTTRTVRRAMMCARKHKVACRCCGAVEMRAEWWTEVRDNDFSQ